jgi:integrase
MPANSTRKRRPRKSSSKPKKPRPDFPLYPHPLGYWSKKIEGRIVHFGRWGRTVKGELIALPYEPGWRDALKAYRARGDDVRAGDVAEFVVQPEGKGASEITLAELCNRFLTSKLRKLESKEKELTPRTFAEYRQATDLLIEHFGGKRRPSRLKPEHFEELRAAMAKRWGPARLGKFVILIRSVFKYGRDNGLLKTKVIFGSEFDKPDKPTMRRHKATGGKKLFTATEVRTILAALNGEEVETVDKHTGMAKQYKVEPNYPLRAATLLAINAGLGNSDVAGLLFSHVDTETAWLDYSRGKTGLGRRAPLWRETLDAMPLAVKHRPKPKLSDDADCVFLNRGGRRMVQSTATSHSDYVSTQFRNLLQELGINGRRNLNFYSLRHTFATIGLQTGDRDAVKSLMGHAGRDILTDYDESGPSDKRLLAVVEHVHAWLFEGGKAK